MKLKPEQNWILIFQSKVLTTDVRAFYYLNTSHRWLRDIFNWKFVIFYFDLSFSRHYLRKNLNTFKNTIVWIIVLFYIFYALSSRQVSYLSIIHRIWWSDDKIGIDSPLFDGNVWLVKSFGESTLKKKKFFFW